VTRPPLPEQPCLRVRLDYTQTDGYDAGSRFFLSYSGAAPTAGNCATLAGEIAAAWNTYLAEVVNDTFALTEVDVLDIGTYDGASGQWTGSHAGTAGGTPLPAQAAMNVEFEISRRYRGGKPRMFLPPSNTGFQLDAGHWDSSIITSVNTQIAAFMADVESFDVGSVGTLAHVNVSYYEGFTNITNSSGRERAVPTYRDTAKIDPVNGYAAKGLIGSQRRRRNASTY